MPGLVFDFDGLMIDSELVLAEAVVEIVTGRGGALAIADFAHLFGSTDVNHEWEQLVPTWCDPPLTLQELEDLLWPAVHDRVDGLTLLPGVEELLDAARAAGWRTALATGHMADRLPGRLERLGLSGRLDAVVMADDVSRGKPAPDIFLEAARRIGLEPAMCVAVEDSVHGCRAALDAGMAVIACPSQVTVHLDFPAAARKVTSLRDVALPDLESCLPAPAPRGP